MKDKFVDFGAVLSGQTVCRPVELINRSCRPVTLRFLTQAIQKDSYTVSVKPKEVTVAVEKITKVTVSYTPHLRGVNMAEKVSLLFYSNVFALKYF